MTDSPLQSGQGLGCAGASHRGCVAAVLQRKTPACMVYAPNYWQWFSHHQSHGLLPAELAQCGSQLEMIRYLGLDVFSRNVYCDQKRGWFGGLSEEVRAYVKDLLTRMRPYSHRFMLAASCNTSIRTPWKTIQWFRDAWQEFA